MTQPPQTSDAIVKILIDKGIEVNDLDNILTEVRQSFISQMQSQTRQNTEAVLSAAEVSNSNQLPKELQKPLNVIEQIINKFAERKEEATQNLDDLKNIILRRGSSDKITRLFQCIMENVYDGARQYNDQEVTKNDKMFVAFQNVARLLNVGLRLEIPDEFDAREINKGSR